ncbi:short-chain alcohol dehydrogenase like protein [Hyaloraphidium curvatum]|nr:short-chain alcohol dehydrogenase like protein [Hyaloraphidium curvatum]
MPHHSPDYEHELNDASAGRAPGLGRLAGKRILVVAGGQRTVPGEEPATSPPGNGRAISIICGREGAAVAVHNRTQEGAEATAQLVRQEQACPKAVALAGDVADEENVKRIVKEAVEQLGGLLDGLVINVGTVSPTPGLDVDMKALDQIMRVNFASHVAFLKHGSSHIRPGGSVVLISASTAALPSGNIPYDSSKAALEGLLRNAGAQLAPSGTRVNILRIGMVDTPLGRLGNKMMPKRMEASIPLMSRLGTSWEPAYYALFLLSDESAYGA